MRVWFAALVALLLLAPVAAAEQTLWFVGDGSSTTIAKPSASLALTAKTNYPMALEGHGGKETNHVVVLGNNLDENGFLPTFIWSAQPLVLTAGDVISVHHYAAVTAGNAAPTACGITGTLYGADGTILKSQKIAATSGSKQEFVFSFTGLEGTFPGLKFQPVQSANQCGWATIDHSWGSDASPGRMVVPDSALGLAAPVVAGPALIYGDLGSAAVAHSFANATSDDYVLNFTTDLTSAVASFIANGTGMVNATLIDASGAELFNGTATTMDVELANVTAGAWQLFLDYTDFNGTFSFALDEPVATPPEDDGPGGSTGNTGGTGNEPDTTGGDGNVTGNETVDGSGDAGKESPGVGLPLLSLGLVAVAFMLRRRK